MKFSKRTDWNTEESDLSKAHRERLVQGLPIADLTASNPTRCGFEYPEDLLDGLNNPAALDYDPNPKGSLPARQAVCQYYAEHGSTVKPEQVILTTSTSEAYSFLFKLLCDPGDSILVPQPSYPLFDFLADIEIVRLQSTPLVYDYGWQLDLESLKKSITPRTRAIVLVHPNNPTGHFTSRAEGVALTAICKEHGLALIVDEVFLDYALDGTTPESLQDRTSFAARTLDIPVFVVSGISKICGLPQMKVAWLVAFGPGADEALERLEVIADTYLSMNAPAQLALPFWLEGRFAMQSQIRNRVWSNLNELGSQLASQTEILVNRLKVEGGWYAVLRVAATQEDEQTALELLNEGVWVHPGYFFGMSKSGWLVVSLLGRSDEFAAGVAILLRNVQQTKERNHNSYAVSQTVQPKL